jgi:hypothetical protein
VTDVPPAVPPAPLPPRAPRPLPVHFAVDTAAAFLTIVILGLIFGLSLGVIVGFAILMGAALTPITRGIEGRQLAERAGDTGETERDGHDHGTGDP